MTAKKPVMCGIERAFEIMANEQARVRRNVWPSGRYLEFSVKQQKAFDHADSECFGILWQPKQIDIQEKDWVIAI